MTMEKRFQLAKMSRVNNLITNFNITSSETQGHNSHTRWKQVITDDQWRNYWPRINYGINYFCSL